MASLYWLQTLTEMGKIAIIDSSSQDKIIIIKKLLYFHFIGIKVAR